MKEFQFFRDRLDANITTLDIEEVIECIVQLGDLYDTSFRRDDDYNLSTELFTKMYGKDYDVTILMKRVSRLYLPYYYLVYSNILDLEET